MEKTRPQDCTNSPAAASCFLRLLAPILTYSALGSIDLLLRDVVTHSPASD